MGYCQKHGEFPETTAQPTPCPRCALENQEPVFHGPQFSPKGWQCPGCWRYFGPHVDECKYCGPALNLKGSV